MDKKRKGKKQKNKTRFYPKDKFIYKNWLKFIILIDWFSLYNVFEIYFNFKHAVVAVAVVAAVVVVPVRFWFVCLMVFGLDVV